MLDLRPSCIAALIASLAGAGAEAQDAPKLSLAVGSVGVVYNAAAKDGGYALRVVFPASTAPGLDDWSRGKDYKETTPVAIEGDLVLFDDKGQLARVPATAAAARFWCENDGGSQFRPELTLNVPARSLKRKLSPRASTQGIAAFAAVVPKNVKAKFKLAEIAWHATDAQRVFDGDFDGDGKPDAVLYQQHDDANNCDGEPQNSLTVELLSGKDWGALRCCGP
jgi:hypothetical protein